MQLGQIHHLEYYVDNLPKCYLFWSWFLEKLNFTEKSISKNGFTYIHESGTYISFVQVEEFFMNIKNSRQGNGLNHVAFAGATLQQLDELYGELQSQEVVILKRTGPLLSFEDQNGLVVEIHAQEDM